MSTDVTYSRVILTYRMLKLDDSIAICLMHTANIDSYLDYEHYVDVLMAALCVPLLVLFGET